MESPTKKEIISNAIKQIEEIRKIKNFGELHQEEDEILCGVLVAMGMGEIVIEYKKSDKWYE